MAAAPSGQSGSMPDVTDFQAKLASKRAAAASARERKIDEIVACWDAMEAAWWQGHAHRQSGNDELARAAMRRADEAKAAFYRARQELHAADGTHERVGGE